MILVTGGAGFIGSHLVDHLTKTNAEPVVVLDSLLTGSLENLSPEVTFVRGDVRDKDQLTKLFSQYKPSQVFHLAALNRPPASVLNPVLAHESNTTGTLNLLELCRRYGSSMMLASSSSVYGRGVGGEEERTHPISPYAASKVAAEAYCQSYAEVYGVQCLVLRYFSVYGPRQTANQPYPPVIAAFLSKAMQGEPLPIYGDGSQRRAYTYVSDVVEITAILAQTVQDGYAVVNVANPTPTSTTELIKLVEEVVGRTVKTTQQPPRVEEPKDIIPDTRRLNNRITGLEMVPLQNGLVQTHEWLRREDL